MEIEPGRRVTRKARGELKVSNSDAFVLRSSTRLVLLDEKYAGLKATVMVTLFRE